MARPKSTHVDRLLHASVKKMSIPNADDIKARAVYDKYCDTFIDKLNSIYLDVSPALHVKHIADTDAQLHIESDPQIKKSLADSKKRVRMTVVKTQTFLNYLEATRSADMLWLQRDAPPDDKGEFTARYLAIAALEDTIQDNVWQGKPTAEAEKKLASLLYVPNERINVTLTQEAATEIAQAVTETARTSKAKILGLAPLR